MAGATTMAVLGIVDKSASVALEYMKNKNIKDKQKYIDELFEAKSKLTNEMSKDNDSQYDNIIEEYTEKVALLLDVVHLDLVKNGGKDA